MRGRTVLPTILLVILSGCSGADRPGPPEAAALIFDGARRVLGTPAFPEDGILLADASVRGPRGTFRTEIVSGTGGLVRMTQTTGFMGGVDAQGAWSRDAVSGSLGALSREGLAMVRGHELHMLALFPEERATESELVGTAPFGTDTALVVRHTLDSEHQLLAFYGVRDTVPLGFRVSWLEPNVVVTLADWVPAGTSQQFRRAVFRQGDEIFEYWYDLVELGTRDDATFPRDRAPVRSEVR